LVDLHGTLPQIDGLKSLVGRGYDEPPRASPFFVAYSPNFLEYDSLLKKSALSWERSQIGLGTLGCCFWSICVPPYRRYYEASNLPSEALMPSFATRRPNSPRLSLSTIQRCCGRLRTPQHSEAAGWSAEILQGGAFIVAEVPRAIRMRSYGELPEPLTFEAVSGRSHSETWAGCIVSLTTPTRSSLSASKSVSSRSLMEKASRVFLASYFLR